MVSISYMHTQEDAKAMAKQLAIHAKFKAQRNKLSKERKRLRREVSVSDNAQRMPFLRSLPI